MPPFRTIRRVEFRDTDAAGIMHFSAFFPLFESVEHEFLRSLGLSVMQPDGNATLSWPRVSASCEYRGAVRFEDVLDISLSIGRLGEKSVTYQCTVDHAGRRVAEGRIVAVCVRMRHNEAMQSVAIPTRYADLLRPYVNDTAI